MFFIRSTHISDSTSSNLSQFELLLFKYLNENRNICFTTLFFGGRESLIFSLVTSSSFFFKSESGERKEQITIFLTASIYWLIGSQNVAPKGETTDSSKSKTDNTTLYTQWNKPSPCLTFLACFLDEFR